MNTEYDSIKRGLVEACQFVKGDSKLKIEQKSGFYTKKNTQVFPSMRNQILMKIPPCAGFVGLSSHGESNVAIVHQFLPLDVKAIREKVNMSQSEFAAAFGILIDDLRSWERGDETPQGPALVLLNVLAKEPKAVLRALSLSSE